jgi:hypothetical protein
MIAILMLQVENDIIDVRSERVVTMNRSNKL